MFQIKARNQNRKFDRRGKKGTTGRGCARAIDEDDGDESSDVDGLDAVMLSDGGNKPTVRLILLEEKIDFLLDTGATNTIINQAAYRKLHQPPLFPTSKRIFASKQPQALALSGKFRYPLIVPRSGHHYEETIYVTADEGDDVNILSCSAAKKLGLVSFSNDVQVNILINEDKNGKLQPVGKMKGVQVKLNIDPTVPGVRVPYRTKSVHLEELEI